MRFALPETVKTALGSLTAAGYCAYLVGGCVRDDALGVRPHDYDIATSAQPDETKKVFSGRRIIETGIRHGTVTVLLSGEPMEITTFRRDGEYIDGRHPESVQFSRALRDDLSRRDFTVNAMAYGENEGVIDLFGGLEDLKNGVICCVGEPEQRFQEDALRILRALRFASRLGFTIEENTRAAMETLKNRIALVSRERVAAEMTGMLLGGDAARILIEEKAIVFAAVPALDAPAWARAVPMLPRVPANREARWAALLAPYGEQAAEGILRGLKMPNALIELVSLMAREFSSPVSPETVGYALTRMKPEAFFLLVSLWAAAGMNMQDAQALEAEAQRILDAGECVSLSALAVRGRHLTALGLTGAEIGETLNALLKEVALHRLPNDRAALLARAESLHAASRAKTL